ncbi:MAG: amidohydrolase family protein, partial [Paracoccaceae bacterium]|nr:amidohydrolase family protein [Paracoccaceae bacterium]
MLIFAKWALLPEGWAENVRIIIIDSHITGVIKSAVQQPNDTLVSALLPALSNLHSHAFQRAMAGMTEHRIAGRDSFWTWRNLMYRFLDRLTPEQMEGIAALVFMEMQEAGYAAVGEFHYVHHQPGGDAYENPAELSNRIFAAASQTGIGLTHLPVLYTYGGAGKQPLTAGQLRFGNSVDRFSLLLENIRAQARVLPSDTRV